MRVMLSSVCFLTTNILASLIVFSGVQSGPTLAIDCPRLPLETLIAKSTGSGGHWDFRLVFGHSSRRPLHSSAEEGIVSHFTSAEQSKWMYLCVRWGRLDWGLSAERSLTGVAIERHCHSGQFAKQTPVRQTRHDLCSAFEPWQVFHWDIESAIRLQLPRFVFRFMSVRFGSLRSLNYNWAQLPIGITAIIVIIITWKWSLFCLSSRLRALRSVPVPVLSPGSVCGPRSH